MTRAGPGAIIRRLGRNAGWILGGRGFAGVVSLAYLAITARTLGPDLFGTFTLILSYGGALGALVQFQTSYAIIRFGAIHLAEQRPDWLARLLGYLALLDIVTSVVGAIIAVLAIPLVGPLFSWTAEQQHGAAIFSAVLLLSTGSTATGMLRLFDRFDLLAYTETIGPLIRLIGAVLLWYKGGGLNGFLVAWGCALAGEALAGWVAALWIKRSRLTIAKGGLRKLRIENERIGAFLIHNNLMSTLALVWQYAGILMVGSVVGPAAAGGFRIASKLAAAAGKPIESVTRALYPEFARLAASNDRATLATVTRRITLAMLVLDVCLVLLVALAGGTILRTIYGPAYSFAAPILLLLMIATAIELSGVALEPILNAHGYSGRLLAAHVLGVAVHLGMLIWLVPLWGVLGAGAASIIAMLVLRGTTSLLLLRLHLV